MHLIKVGRSNLEKSFEFHISLELKNHLYIIKTSIVKYGLIVFLFIDGTWGKMLFFT